MTEATLPNLRRASRLLAPTGDLVLRVLGAEHEGREIRIRSPKCTIGSARGCTLRLTATRVRSLHCWILRGAGGTIVRRRDPRTRLNGRRFVDAPLAPGDRLQIGSVELEVADCPRVPADWTIQSADLPEPLPADSGVNSAESPVAQQAAQEAEELRSEFHNLQRRAAEQLGEVNSKLDQITQERTALAEQLRALEEQSTRERGELAELLAGAEAELAQERTQLSQRLQTLEAEAISERDSLVLEKEKVQLSLASSEQELADLRSRQSSRESEIESKLHAGSQRVASMEGQLQQAARERNQLEKKLQKQTESLHSKVQAREAERDRLAEQCQRLEHQAAQLRELLGYTSAERDQLSLRLDSREQSSYDQQRKVAAEKEELQRRLDAMLAKFTGANLPPAPQGSETVPMPADHAHGSDLRQLTEELMLEKQALEGQIEQQTTAWQRERESLRQQTDRVTEHCKQVDGQLSNVRGLLETLVTERDAIGQQLTAADARLVTEQQQWQEQRASLERQIQGQSSSVTDKDRQLSELAARLEAESSRARQAEQITEDKAQQLARLDEQLAEANQRLAKLQSEGDSRVASESARFEKLGREAGQSRDELIATQVALVDAETQLAALRVESFNGLQSEQEKRLDAQRRCEQLTRDLATADLRLTEAERKLSAFRISGDDRLNDALKRTSEFERLLKAADEELVAIREQLQASEARTTTLQIELDAQQAAHQQAKESAAVRWALLEEQTSSLLEQLEGRSGNATQVLPSQDRQAQSELKRVNQYWRESADEAERLKKECRTLREQLEAKGREVAGLAAQVKDAENASPTGCVTVPYANLKQTLAADGAASDERQAWSAEREQLQQRIAQLEQQLTRQECSQSVTLGADAIAELQAGAADRQVADEAAQLKARLDALQGELAEAGELHERCQTAEAAAQKQRDEVERLKSEVQSLQQQLATAASNSVAQSVTLVGPIPSPAEGAEGVHSGANDEQQSALVEERRALEEDRALLETARQQLAAEREEVLRSQRESEAQWRERSDQLRHQEELLASQAEELAGRLEQAAAQEATLESQRFQLAAEANKADRRVNHDSTSNGRSNGAAPSGPTPADRPMEEFSDARPPAAAAESPLEGKSAAASEPNAESPPAAVRESSLIRRSGTRPKPVWTQPESPPADESIEAYMSRLLQRVSEYVPVVADVVRKTQPPVSTRQPEAGGPKPEFGGSVVADQESKNDDRKLEVRGQGSALPPAPVSPDAESSPNADSKVRESSSQSPETPTTMEAMREVANTAARSAIVRHRRDLGNRLAVAQAVGAGMTLVATMAAGWCAYRVESIFGGLGAAIGFVAACFWFGKALGHALKALLLEAPEVDASPDPEPAAEAESTGSASATAGDNGQPIAQSASDPADNDVPAQYEADPPSGARAGSSPDLVTTQSS